MTVTSLSVFRFPSRSSKLWAFFQMVLARRALATTPDIGFHKLMGSGTEDGFCPYPNFAVYGILAVWPSLQIAQDRVQNSTLYRRYQSHSEETFSIFLAPTQSRGRWSGKEPFEITEAGISPYGTAVAALTRATLKPQHARSFWNQVPGISVDIAKQTDMVFKIGLGEVPWLHQATFSIWRDVAPMENFAFKTFHGTAIRRVREGGWFKEELFARFALLGTAGTWGGIDPLSVIEAAPAEIKSAHSEHPAIA